MRRILLRAARNDRLRRTVESAPVARNVVRRFVPGQHADDAVAATKDLHNQGLQVTVDYLGEDITDHAHADLTVDAYLTVLGRLADAGLTQGGAAEASLKLSSVGQLLDPSMARENAMLICQAAAAAGTTVTLDMEDHTTTDGTLEILREVRRDYPTTGAVLQAYLHRTEADCRDLAHSGSRVRLCKGAYKEPATVAYQSRADVNASYERCLQVLFAGDGYPMVATHDPRLIDLTTALSVGRPRGSFEYQMLYGIRPDEQTRLASDGSFVRVYVPYGEQYYGYFMRRLAERPANMAFFARALLSKD